jgi:23S rRNA pseudouridine2605 synthase
MTDGPITFPVRLNRYIASCGRASRRKAEELIREGRVAVDGIVEESLGRVLSGSETVCVDGCPIVPARQVYLVMNKPCGVLSAASDRRERTVVDLLPERYRSLRVFPVGRLDKDSEGLLLLTNDGKFAQELIHPSFGIRRVYSVTLRSDLDDNAVEEWRSGIIIEGRLVKPLGLSPLDGTPGKRFEVILGEGFKREVRLMVSSLGNRVIRLKRTGLGNLSLNKLPVGAYYEYNYDEIMVMIREGGEV